MADIVSGGGKGEGEGRMEDGRQGRPGENEIYAGRALRLRLWA